MYDQPLASLVASLGSDIRNGLSQQAAAERLARDGKNVLQMAKSIPWWKRLASQFYNLMIALLIAAAIIAGFLGDWIDTAAILSIVVLNALLGFFQEQRAEQAMGALNRLSAPQAKTKRDGITTLIPAEQLVVGDIISLEAGKATAIVTSTGMNTEIGGIARLLQQTEAEQTPLQRRLAELGQVLVKVCLSLVAVIFVLQWLRGEKLADVLLTSVTVICTDKTGTLTQNEMTVRKLWVFDRTWRVDGQGYSPKGDIHLLQASTDSPDAAGHPETLVRLLQYADGCNNAVWPRETASKPATSLGDPTEIALKIVAAKAGVVSGWTLDDLVHENPFESDRKRMSQVYRDESGGLLMIVKGAQEEVLAVSSHFLQIFYSMACRDFDRIIPSVGLFSNPFLVFAVVGSVAIQLAAIAIPWSAEILGLHAMPWSDAPMIILLSLIPVTLVELKKMLFPK